MLSKKIAIAFILSWAWSLSAHAKITDSVFRQIVPVQLSNGLKVPITVYEAALKQGVPKIPLDLTFTYFDQNKTDIPNQKFVTIIDYSVHSAQERMFLINMENGRVEKLLVAHGRGSDPNHDGMADSFSNVPQSQATSLGFFLTAETYTGANGYSLRLDGLSESNSNARPRAIVIHGAEYVQKGFEKMGRSFGCPALEQELTRPYIDRVKNGSLIFSYSNKI